MLIVRVQRGKRAATGAALARCVASIRRGCDDLSPAPNLSLIPAAHQPQTPLPSPPPPPRLCHHLLLLLQHQRSLSFTIITLRHQHHSPPSSTTLNPPPPPPTSTTVHPPLPGRPPTAGTTAPVTGAGSVPQQRAESVRQRGRMDGGRLLIVTIIWGVGGGAALTGREVQAWNKRKLRGCY